MLDDESVLSNIVQFSRSELNVTQKRLSGQPGSRFLFKILFVSRCKKQRGHRTSGQGFVAVASATRCISLST